jgi:hypothetical protein
MPNSYNEKLIGGEIAFIDPRTKELLITPAFAIAPTTRRNYFTETAKVKPPL